MTTSTIKTLFLLGSAAVMAQASAADVRDQLNIQTGKAVLVIPGVAPQQAAEQVKDAITQFAIPTSLNFHPLPAQLPAVPASPTEKQVIISGAPATDFVCDNAYAEITKTPPPVQNAFYFNREALRACLYAFQGGVKVELIFHVMHKSESMTSGLFSGIAKGIRGTDGERITGQLKENIAKIRKNLPATLVARIDAPGMPLAEPDKIAVEKIIPPLSEPQLAAQAQQMPNVPQVQQPAPGPQTRSAAPDPAGGVDLSLAGARRELAAMGFKFFDQDQFVDAARRDDFLTVRLFLAAGAIHPGAPDSKGDTALRFAKDRSEMKIFLTIYVAAEKEGKYPANISEAVFAK